MVDLFWAHSSGSNGALDEFIDFDIIVCMYIFLKDGMHEEKYVQIEV